MKNTGFLNQTAAIFGIVVASTVPFGPAAAQNAPGEDPVILTKRIWSSNAIGRRCGQKQTIGQRRDAGER